MSVERLETLFAAANPPRPIPDWWSEEAVLHAKQAQRKLAALAPDAVRLVIDMAAELPRHIEGHTCGTEECWRCSSDKRIYALLGRVDALNEQADTP